MVVVGATGNVGTSVLRSLADEPAVESVVGIARRRPAIAWPKTSWVQADISRDDLRPHFTGADAVVHLAWLIQPSRDMATLRLVRLRPGLVFKREAASEIRRYFAGPLLPGPLVRAPLIPVVPDVPGLRFQVVHSYDVGNAHRLALVRDVRGPFNLAAEPVLDPDELAEVLGARKVPVPAAALRASADATWKMRLQPSPVGWVDMALSVPLMDTTRAREDLGWMPRRTSHEALLDLLNGLRDGSGVDTPPLAPGAGGPLRVREFLTGVGGRST